MEEIHVIGYSGHAYVCIETALSANKSVVGYFETAEKQENPFQLPYLGSELKQTEFKRPIFVAIGDNLLRRKICHSLQPHNPSYTTLIHARSIVSNTATIESNSLINAGAIINAFTTIGFGTIINSGAVIEHNCIIGDFVHIAPSCTLAGDVKVGNNTFIGANSTVKQGITIGENITIGMGSVVTRDLLEPGVYVGSPAKKIK